MKVCQIYFCVSGVVSLRYKQCNFFSEASHQLGWAHKMANAWIATQQTGDSNKKKFPPKFLCKAHYKLSGLCNTIFIFTFSEELWSIRNKCFANLSPFLEAFYLVRLHFDGTPKISWDSIFLGEWSPWDSNFSDPISITVKQIVLFCQNLKCFI